VRERKRKANNYFQKFNLIQLARAEETTHNKCSQVDSEDLTSVLVVLDKVRN